MAIDPYPSDLVNPFGLASDDGYTWLKGNLHCHTSNSDGRLPPQERVDAYAAHGYDYLCLSDHRAITRVDSVTCPSGLTLIQGVELHPENPEYEPIVPPPDELNLLGRVIEVRRILGK